ncbi:MAG: sulfite exporter TauE/SafE family protein [Acidimicrobiales bacterium]
MDLRIIGVSALVGLLIGLTGSGGGALMTPLLVLLFGYKAPAAIGSDLIASLFMRPIGALVHVRRGTIRWPIVGWLALGSVPGGFAGAALLHLLGSHGSSVRMLEYLLGVVLVAGALATVWRTIRGRSAMPTSATIALTPSRRALLVLLGLAGGLTVGVTSVGAGSLMIVGLVACYPMLSNAEVVGTDLAQAIPLTLAAALGAVYFGVFDTGLVGAMIIGSTPGVLIGAHFSSRSNGRVLRGAVAVVIFVSGLRYLGVISPLPLFLAGLGMALLTGSLTFRQRSGGLPAAIRRKRVA